MHAKHKPHGNLHAAFVPECLGPMVHGLWGKCAFALKPLELSDDHKEMTAIALTLNIYDTDGVPRAAYRK